MKQQRKIGASYSYLAAMTTRNKKDFSCWCKWNGIVHIMTTGSVEITFRSHIIIYTL